MNNRLLSAMKAAHVTIDDIAELTDVDRRTVQRWLQGRIPHPNHRWTIVEHLKIREELLWPSDISNENVNINCSAEMIALYSHRASVPINAWWHLLLQAHQHIDLLAYAMLFLPEQHPSAETRDLFGFPLILASFRSRYYNGGRQMFTFCSPPYHTERIFS